MPQPPKIAKEPELTLYVEPFNDSSILSKSQQSAEKLSAGINSSSSIETQSADQSSITTALKGIELISFLEKCPKESVKKFEPENEGKNSNLKLLQVK